MTIKLYIARTIVPLLGGKIRPGRTAKASCCAPFEFHPSILVFQVQTKAPWLSTALLFQRVKIVRWTILTRVFAVCCSRVLALPKLSKSVLLTLGTSKPCFAGFFARLQTEQRNFRYANATHLHELHGNFILDFFR